MNMKKLLLCYLCPPHCKNRQFHWRRSPSRVRACFPQTWRNSFMKKSPLLIALFIFYRSILPNHCKDLRQVQSPLNPIAG